MLFWIFGPNFVGLIDYINGNICVRQIVSHILYFQNYFKWKKRNIC